MGSEKIARIVVIILVLAALAIPLAGRVLTNVTQPRTIELHARMPESGGWSMEEIQVQVGEPLHLRITSDDVIHGFAVGKIDQPAIDILPGEFAETTLVFDKPGKYTFYCNRWCGANHWRMRGTIEVVDPASGSGLASQDVAEPLFLRLGIDPDNPQRADVVPAKPPDVETGERLASQLPDDVLQPILQRDIYLSSSPEELWQSLRNDDSLHELSDQDLWDLVDWVWMEQSSPEALALGEKLYTGNCLACHGEAGNGDGVMVRGLPVWDPQKHSNEDMSSMPNGEGLYRPPDFTDPGILLGNSPALLEGKIIRGGMGTGMPYWGPILTNAEMDAVISYLYQFAWRSQ